MFQSITSIFIIKYIKNDTNTFSKSIFFSQSDVNTFKNIVMTHIQQCSLMTNRGITHEGEYVEFTANKDQNRLRAGYYSLLVYDEVSDNFSKYIKNL